MAGETRLLATDLSVKIQQSIANLRPVKPRQQEIPTKTASKPATMLKHRSKTLTAGIDPAMISQKTRTLPTNGKIVGEITIKDLVQRFSHLIPFRATVVAGNMDYVPTIETGDTLIVHAIKKSQVVTISDSQDVKHNVPIYSSAKFGIVSYSNSREHASTFSVLELMEARSLPLVVACLVEYEGCDSSMSFKQSEILLLKEATQLDTFESYRKIGMMKVYSITDSMMKYIPKEADNDIFFSNEPSNIQMYLTEIIKHASHLLPCRARIFVPDEHRSLLRDLGNDSVVIEKKSTDTSLLACRVDGCSGSKTYVEISTSIRLTVVLSLESFKTRKQDLDKNKYTTVTKRADILSGHLLKMIRKGYETQGSVVGAARCSGSDEGVSEPANGENEHGTVHTDKPGHHKQPQVHRNLALKEIAKQNEEVTPYKPSKSRVTAPLAIMPQAKQPPASTELPKKQVLPPVFQPKETSSSSPGLAQLKAAPPSLKSQWKMAPTPPFPQPKVDLPSTQLKMETAKPAVMVPTSQAATEKKPTKSTADKPKNAVPLPPKNSSKQNETTNGEISLSPVRQEVKTGIVDKSSSDQALLAISEGLHLLLNRVEKIEQKQTKIEADIAQLKHRRNIAAGRREIPQEVCSMTQQDVLKLLEAMLLPQYREAFSREWVDGEVFKDLDEEALQELGVASKLHRMKLMKVITGSYSLDKYFK